MKKMISYLLLSHCWLLNILPAQNAPQVIGLGQNSHIAVTTSNNQTGRVGENTLSTEGFTPNDNAAARFLHQASFGPTYEEILSIKNIGLENWIDQQFATPKAFGFVDKVLELTAIKNANGATNLRPGGPLIKNSSLPLIPLPKKLVKNTKEKSKKYFFKEN